MLNKKGEPMTQTEAILIDLKEGKLITPLDALERHGCFRLAAIIHNLRKEGYNIKTTKVSNKLSGAKYARYSLISGEKNTEKEYLTNKVYQF